MVIKFVLPQLLSVFLTVVEAGPLLEGFDKAEQVARVSEPIKHQ